MKHKSKGAFVSISRLLLYLVWAIPHEWSLALLIRTVGTMRFDPWVAFTAYAFELHLETI